MNLSATVLHNVSGDSFFRYHPETSRLYHAHTFQIVADNADQGADLIWTLTNVDDANHLASIQPHLSRYGSQVTAYRRRKNRSLSVGDVVIFREIAGDPGVVDARVLRLAGVRVVAGMGWESLEAEPGHNPGSNKTNESLSYAAYQYRRNR